MSTREQIAKSFQGPKSVCVCGHLGDGVGMVDPLKVDAGIGLHLGAIGHGVCVHDRCRCKQFTWADFSPAFKDALAKADDAA